MNVLMLTYVNSFCIPYVGKILSGKKLVSLVDCGLFANIYLPIISCSNPVSY